MKMREYVDGLQGPGSWDRMHDLIEKRQLFGWRLPPIPLGEAGGTVHIFPGTDREVTLEAVQAEVLRAINSVQAGDYEDVLDDED